jgi:hypothetical protein
MAREGIDMASKTSGKRGSAIIVLMVVAAIAGSPSAALASPGKSRGPAPATPPQAAVVVTAPAVVPQLGFGFNADASWADASWAEE